MAGPDRARVGRSREVPPAPSKMAHLLATEQLTPEKQSSTEGENEGEIGAKGDCYGGHGSLSRPLGEGLVGSRSNTGAWHRKKDAKKRAPSCSTLPLIFALQVAIEYPHPDQLRGRGRIASLLPWHSNTNRDIFCLVRNNYSFHFIFFLHTSFCEL